jgi:RNA polymerase sigma-B factor
MGMPTHSTRSTHEDARAEELLTELAATPAQDPRWEQIRSELVRIHKPLVAYIVRRYAHGPESRQDIEQAAMLGLVKAINRYDPAYGGRFMAFAMPTMTGEVKRHFRDHTWAMRVPRRLQELRLDLRTARRDFVQEHGRVPTVPEISEALGITEEETIEVLGATDAYRTVSLDTPMTDEEDDLSLGALIGDDDPHLENVVDRTALRPLLEQLPARERTVLLHRFYGNKTQTEIAALLGISQMHVSRIISRTLAKLRTQLLQDA